MHKFTLEIKGLTKSFRGKRAVDSVSFTVPSGEIVGFLGPNGAGKTTVMSIITGLLSPDDGEVWLFGENGGAHISDIRKRIGYLQEKPRIYPDMTARDYLLLFAKLYSVNNPTKRVSCVMDRVGISFAADRTLGTFSRGMQQRACLARTMLHEPKFLVLDEPTLGLDPVGVADLRDIFREMKNEGVTLMFSSHQLAEIERVCDSVILLSEGKVVAQGRPADLLPTAGQDSGIIVELFEPVRPFLRIVQALPNVVKAVEVDTNRISIVLLDNLMHTERDRRADVARIFTGLGLTVLSTGNSSNSLEEVFLKLTNGDRNLPLN